MGKVHMNKGRAGEDRGSKETDGCPLTIPIVLELGSEHLKVSLELLVKMFCLAIGLSVISHQSHEFNSQYMIEFMCELGDKLRALIRKNCLGESMVLPDFSIK
jgi:hypothetical protein